MALPVARHVRTGVFFTLCLFMCGGLLCASESGDAFVSGSIAQPRTLIPILASDSASASVADFLYNGLVKYDKDLNIVGDLAERWDISEDGTRITFYLRKNVRWHDGHEFTARDVVFTYRQLINPALPTPYSGDFKRVDRIEISDPHTLTVIYKEPFSPGLISWAMSMIPEHLLKEEDLTRTDFSRFPVGTGAYTFKKWVSYEKIELAANPDYFEGRPLIDRVVIKVIPDDATIFLELLTEGIDNSGLTPLQYRRQTESARFKQAFTKFRYPSNSYLYMAYNLSDALFADTRVRTAIAHAVNVQDIIEAVFLSEAHASSGPYTPLSWGWNESVQPLAYDRARAQSLLEAAGWKDTDRDGWLDKQGRRFEFTVVTNQGNSQRQNIAEIIQQQLKDVGIKVKIKVVEWSVFVDQIINKKKFDAVLLGWNLSYDPDLYDIWSSTKTKEGEFNFIGYHNPEVDRLLEQGRVVFDIAERKRIYQRVHELIYRDQPYLFICVPDSLTALHTRFEGVVPAKRGYWYNFREWWVPRQKQKYHKTTVTP